MSQQSFSLYKLPLVGSLVVFGIYILFQTMVIEGGNLFVSDFYQLSILVTLGIIANLLMDFLTIFGALTILFYHFNINNFTKKNIRFTLALVLFFTILKIAITYLLISLQEYYAIDNMYLMIIFYLKIVICMLWWIFPFIIGALPMLSQYLLSTVYFLHF